MSWDPQTEFWLGVVFLISAMISMIFIAAIGYFVTRFVYEVRYGIQEESTAQKKGSTSSSQTPFQEEAD